MAAAASGITPTTNWTNATGTASNPYDPTAASVTVFGASGSSTPATGGTVVVNPGGIQLTGTVDFNATGDNSIYTIRGGNLTVAAGGTSFNVDNVAVSGASAVIASNIVGSNGISVFGPGTLLLTGANTYAGGTFICSCASLQLGDATHTASIVGAVTNYGTFNIVNANTSGITSITNDLNRRLASGFDDVLQWHVGRHHDHHQPAWRRDRLRLRLQQGYRQRRKCCHRQQGWGAHGI